MQISIFEPKFNQAVIDLILTIQQEEFSLPISLTEQPDLLDLIYWTLKILIKNKVVNSG